MAGQPAYESRTTIEERLERGGIEYFPICPFLLPSGEDHQFLLGLRLGSRAHKNISYDPESGRVGGHAALDNAQVERLRHVLAMFSASATTWLKSLLPGYSTGWKLDRVSYRPEEEATRKLRHKARNDLLHIDAFPSRPSQGWRILRLFVNINPTEPRIWATSDSFGRLLERFGSQAGLPKSSDMPWTGRLRDGVIRLFSPRQSRRSMYDAFMLKFHDYLKANDDFQEHGPKRFWSFPPGASWLAFTDTASHAVLRGRYALEHSYFLDPSVLALAEESPAALLAKAAGIPVLRRAA